MKKMLLTLLAIPILSALLMAGYNPNPGGGSTPSVATGADVTAGTDNAKMVTAKALADANIKRNIFGMVSYTSDFTINSALSGYTISNHGATQDIKGTFASDLPDGFSCRVVNEVGNNGVDSYTKLMLHMNGADDGTIFTDSSASAHTITPTNAVTKTATKKFGTASGYFNGADHSLAIPNSSILTIGTGDFTFAGWFYFNSLTGDPGIYSQTNDINNRHTCFVGAEGYLFVYIIIGSSVQATYSTENGVISAGEWVHLELVRNGTTLILFKNGVPVTWKSSGKVEISTKNISSINAPFLIGGFGAQATNAYFDEIKYDIGIARHVVDFSSTLQSAEYYSFTITLSPPSGGRLPNTSAVNRNSVSSAFGDSIKIYKTANNFIAESYAPSPNNWVDTAQP